jgi:hypothetical protein
MKQETKIEISFQAAVNGNSSIVRNKDVNKIEEVFFDSPETELSMVNCEITKRNLRRKPHRKTEKKEEAVL